MHINAVSAMDPLRQKGQPPTYRPAPGPEAPPRDKVTFPPESLSLLFREGLGLAPDQPITLDSIREVIREDTAEVQKQPGFICHEPWHRRQLGHHPDHRRPGRRAPQGRTHGEAQQRSRL